MLDTFDLSVIVEPLQSWFDGSARVLPWRSNPKAYYVWVSEIMLQQTRVEAVKPYFERFILELPDVKALAECEEDRLLKLWEGLGYYNRVRNLNMAAKEIMDKYDGELPSDYEELLKLKGIGNYTAGAISSIAYGKPNPAVDGNVLRVISRVCKDDSDIMKQSVRSHMEQILKALMENPAAGVIPAKFNQALMELGACVCVPNGEPHCEECPLREVCESNKDHTQMNYPVKSKGKRRRIEKRTIMIVRDGAMVSLHKRPNTGLLAGLYEIPNVEGHLSQDEVIEFLKNHGMSPIRIRPLADAKHIFSHIEWHMIGYVITIEENYEQDMNWIFVECEDAKEHYAIPSAFVKYTDYLNIPLGIDREEE